MQPQIQEAAGRLRDIVGIDGVPWWPLAPGWWAILGGALLVYLVAYRWRTFFRLRVPIPGITLGTWRWEAAARLRDLKRRARSGQDPKATAGELSELLRRIAMARIGRGACAGLNGQAWLDWLAEQDPNAYPWRERGRPLLEIPYAPPARPGVKGAKGAKGGKEASDAQALLGLIDAAYAWVSAPDPKPRRKAREPGWRRLFSGWTGPGARAARGSVGIDGRRDRRPDRGRDGGGDRTPKGRRREARDV